MCEDTRRTDGVDKLCLAAREAWDDLRRIGTGTEGLARGGVPYTVKDHLTRPNPMFVCNCPGISESTVRQAITEANSPSLDSLRQSLGVASCCGCCTDDVLAMLPAIEPEGAQAA